MRSLKSLFLLIVSLSLINVSFAECDWSKIQKVEDGYLYSKELNLCVGELVKTSKLKDEQIALLKSSIELKDLAIQKTEERVELWKRTSFSLEDRLNSSLTKSKYETWLYFGAGMLLLGTSVYLSGKVYR